tara:strand:- start:922 stop:1086 length:165 start_codon:yes stop_codon:yes gene_type:complete
MTFEYKSPKYWAEMKRIRQAHEAKDIAIGKRIPKEKLSKPLKDFIKKGLDKTPK